MYHILPPKGQAQFRGIKTIDEVQVQSATVRHAHKLATAVAAAVRCLDQHNGRLLGIQGSRDPVESLNQQSGPAGETQIVCDPTDEKLLHPIGKVCSCSQRCLRCPRKMVLRDRNFNRATIGRHPESPAGEPDADVRNHAAIGIGYEADQPVVRQHLARDDAAAFANRIGLIGLDRRRCCRHTSPCSSTASSSAGSSGSSSIHPAFTRAFMMMALASSVVRLNDSSAPGTRTRSLSLPSS